MKNRRHFLISATKVFAVGLGASLMLGCATPDPIAGPAVQVGFAHLPSMTFNVTRVDVGSTYNSPMQAPNAEHRMPAPPQRALFDWARTRLKASVTSQAVATFVVEDAAVIETKLQKTPGLKALFTYEAAERYDARVVASLSLNDPVSGASGSVQVRSDRSIEVRENATPAEREHAWGRAGGKHHGRLQRADGHPNQHPSFGVAGALSLLSFPIKVHGNVTVVP